MFDHLVEGSPTRIKANHSFLKTLYFLNDDDIIESFISDQNLHRYDLNGLVVTFLFKSRSCSFFLILVNASFSSKFLLSSAKMIFPQGKPTSNFDNQTLIIKVLMYIELLVLYPRPAIPELDRCGNGVAFAFKCFLAEL